MADPTHRRRSSISEQIQRVFNVDRSDKKRRHIRENGSSDVLAQLKSGYEMSQASISQTSVQLGQDETRPSSFTYSQHSGLPLTGTSHSAPPFQPVKTVDTMPLQTPGIHTPTQQDICTSPVWHTAPKERRATRRLEAERKELEQRLQRLEEAQARLNHGNAERSPNRLTKKQPLDNSAVRSSSSDREGRRGRSSSVLSGIFSSSRRTSRSRSKDSESRRQSSDTPPTLPLALPERFGTAVSRELAARHGTTLDASHQLESTVRAPHSLHSAPKSDDLRENWRMAEAWQRKNGTQGFENTTNPHWKPDLGGQPEFDSVARQNEPQRHTQADLSADLDRALFTATLRHDGKPMGKKSSSATSPYAHTSARPIGLSKRDRAQSETFLKAPVAMSTRVTTARQLHDLAPSGPTQRSYKELGFSLSMPITANPKHHKKNEFPAGSQASPTSFKSSPLSSNVFKTKVTDEKENNGMPKAPTMQSPDASIIPLPLRIQVPQQHDAARGRDRKPTSEPTLATTRSNSKDNRRQSLQGPVPSFANTNRQQENWRPRQSTTGTDEEVKQPRNDGPPLPIKHAGRITSLSNSPPPWLKNESQKEAGVAADAPITLSGPSAKEQYTAEEAPIVRSVLRCRSSSLKPTQSQSSSQASYDTADEEVLDITKAIPDKNRVEAQSNETRTLTLKDETPVSQEPLPNDSASQRETLPLPRYDTSARLRKASKRPIKTPAEQLITKLFVICCHCKYWHDMPSEVYARLACPEVVRLPPESLLSRASSPGDSGGRKAASRKSLLSSDLSDTRRRLLAIGQKPPIKGANRDTQTATGMPLRPPSCCWCGHNMSKSCCQGWTTLVQMGERHH